MAAAATESGSLIAAREPLLMPGALPLIGHLRQLRADPFAFLSSVRDTIGDVGAYRVGPYTAVLVSDPAAIERVHVEHTRAYSKNTRGYQELRHALGNGLVTSQGAFWLRQRRIAQPAFHRERIAGLVGLMQEETARTIAALAADTTVASGVDLMPALNKLTMRFIARALFTTDVSDVVDRVGQAVGDVVHIVVDRVLSPVRPPLWIPTPQNRKVRRANATLDAVIYPMIAGRRASEARGAEAGDLLSMLMHATDSETGERMSDPQLRDEVATLFSAGHETTANALAFCFWTLLQHPDALARLRAEVEAVAGGGPIGLAEAGRLAFTEAVIKETMRLYPPVWMVVRRVEEADLLGGHRVAPGMFIMTSQFVVHRHPRLWSEPERFQPERFLADDPQRPKYAYFPFLGGPRKCIGDQLALLEAKVMLAMLVRALDFTLADGARLALDPAATLRPKHGVPVRITPRAASGG